MSQWISICNESDITAGAGVCALHQEEQVAVFKTADNSLYAVSNYDPIGEANVISRGIIGSCDDTIVVASPLYKQRFCLTTGKCLDDEQHQLKTYSVRLQGNDIQLLSE